MDIIEELREITAKLDQEGVDYALCGGLAMAIYALPRATMDIDMKIDMSPEAIRIRLEQVRSLRNLCLSLARSSAARAIAKKYPANKKVQRTLQTLGR